MNQQEPTGCHEFERAFRSHDSAAVRRVLSDYPELRTQINEPMHGCFDAPIVTLAKTPDMLDALLEAGADINMRSRWWAGGFGLLHSAPPELAKYAINLGARVDAHSAARLGLLDHLRRLIEQNPEIVHDRGPDGQTPLHFASSIEVAELLLRHGANIDARDIDHESTPAQYMVADRQNVARCLIKRGCKTDILMATAMGDKHLVEKHLKAEPGCIRMRVSAENFPMVSHKSGGTIYQWTLGFYVSAHQVAKKFSHADLFEFLMDQSPPELKIVSAAWVEDELLLHALLEEHPRQSLNYLPEDHWQISHAARNNAAEAVRLMLEAGLLATSRGQHHATPLHWAAWHGNLEMVKLLLHSGIPLEDKENDFESTPVGWAVHGSENGWHRETGDYVETLNLLLNAGAKPPSKIAGTEQVQQLLRTRGVPE